MWVLIRTGKSKNSSDSVPRMRSKHSMCWHDDDSCMYLLGGRNGNLPLKDFWKFDPLSNEWIQIKCGRSGPPCLQEHTMVTWQNQVYVFGGEVGFASNDRTPLWIFNVDTGVWKTYQQDDFSTPCPSGRRGHTAVVSYNAMHIYGGYQDLRGSSDELWTFDFETECWHLHPSPKHVDMAPPARHNHSAVVHDGAMWIYGGMTDLQQKSDFWKWEFDTGNWFRLRSKTGPGELHSHSACKVMSAMLVFGGEKCGVLVNELWRYHFGIDVWERVQVTGISPSPSSKHIVIANPEHDLSPSVSMFSDTQSKWSSQMSCAVKTPTSGHPPKSVSMYSSLASQQDDQSERFSARRHFRSRIHPVSRLCSKSMSSDEEDDLMDKDSGYRSGAGSRIIPSSQSQSNLRSIRDKISSRRLVRSISGSSYSILQNRFTECQDENQCPVDAINKTVPNKKPNKNVYKSHSSDALLEADDESTSSNNDNGDQHQPLATRNNDMTSLPGSVRQTSSFYNIHSCDNGCDEHSVCQENKLNDVATMLIDLENSPKRPSAEQQPEMSIKYVKGSDSQESCHINVSSPLSNLPNPHQDFAGCLNTANKRRDTSKSKFRYSLNVELKTFTPETSPYRSTTRLATTPGSQPSIRSKSLDRESHQKREQLSEHVPTTPQQNRNNVSGFYGSQYMKAPPRLCMYVFGGKAPGSKTEYKQSLMLWQLYL